MSEAGRYSPGNPLVARPTGAVMGLAGGGASLAPAVIPPPVGGGRSLAHISDLKLKARWIAVAGNLNVWRVYADRPGSVNRPGVARGGFVTHRAVQFLDAPTQAQVQISARVLRPPGATEPCPVSVPDEEADQLYVTLKFSPPYMESY